MEKTKIEVVSKAYLEGKITDKDYKVMIHSYVNKNKGFFRTERKAIASSILKANKTFLEDFAKGILMGD